jgi:hypothetical protein
MFPSEVIIFIELTGKSRNTNINPFENKRQVMTYQ